MGRRMPSPIGHALAGAAIAWGFEDQIRRIDGRPAAQRTRDRVLPVACVALAAMPDLDLLAPYTHRTVTHSLMALACIAIVAIAVTGKVTGRVGWAMVLACTAAYGSHLLLDWLAEDDTAPRGVQLLWPFSRHWFISGWDLFRGTARIDVFSLRSMQINALAVAQEIAILGPVAVFARLVRVKAPPRLPAEMTGGHHPAQ